MIGDIHGDAERMREVLAEVDDETPLVAVGDYFDRWTGALDAVRWLMRRPNTTALLGNHDALILGVLEEHERGETGRCTDNWKWNGGRDEDLEGLLDDPEAAEWLRGRPAMAMLGDVLVQHCDSPVYLNYGASVEAVNRATAARLRSRDPEVLLTLFADLCRRRQFYAPRDLDAYLGVYGARVLVHGHTPHNHAEALTLFNGRLVNVDGAMSRGFGPGRRGFVHWVETVT